MPKIQLVMISLDVRIILQYICEFFQRRFYGQLFLESHLMTVLLFLLDAWETEKFDYF